MNSIISAKELQQQLTINAVNLIDVLLPEDFACRHVAGAKNACVYEMVFLDRIKECVPDLDSKVVVYDDSGLTLTARTAMEKMKQAGYRNVAMLEGGLQAWQAAEFAVESIHPVPPAAPVCDGVYRIDVKKSVLEWTGRNINNRHYGRIPFSGGEVVMANSKPVSGSFVLDMNSISNLDLQDEGWRNLLLQHLRSSDFFDVEHYPTASFKLLGAAEITKSTTGTPNMEIAGSLTVKDSNHPLCFPAIVAAQEDGSLKAQASIDLDRTIWNVCYGSGKLYERLGMHLVNDLISIEMFVVAGKAE